MMYLRSLCRGIGFALAILCTVHDAAAQQCGLAADADVVIMVDVTGSTNAGELANQKAGIKQLLGFFAGTNPQPRVAIGTFHGDASDPAITDGGARIQPNGNLTNVYGDDGTPGTGLYKVVNEIVRPPQNSTNLAITIAKAQAEIAANGAVGKNHYIIVISDGVANKPDASNPANCSTGDPGSFALAEAMAAVQAGTQIFAIHYGTDEPECVPEQQTGVNFLKNSIATSPLMFFDEADAAFDLQGIFNQIAQAVACDDGKACTTDSCDTQNFCAFTVNDPTDTDGDGVPDCIDQCPGGPDGDSDSDGVVDCKDGCPSDPNKVQGPGICGCGIADVDTDGDGTLDCNEQCPQDAQKLTPGQCGCGIADTDSDGDQSADCNDGCPSDPAKSTPGQCGCGAANTDSDGDGTANCNDGCPNDAPKTAAGTCGCGIADTDLDSNGVTDCLCESIDNTQANQDLAIGPEQLAEFSRTTLRRLIRTANRTNPGLSKRLKRSSKQADVKLTEFIRLATQVLDSLPSFILVCPASPACAAVDNSDKIEQYKSAVQLLANQIIRTLNRATRLIFPSVKAAKKNTRAFGKTIRAARDQLRAKADALPKVQTFCAPAA